MSLFRSSSPQDRKAAVDTAQKTVIVLAVTLVTAAVAYVLYLLRSTVLELIVALVFAVALEPFVQFFLRRRLSRVWSVILAMVISLSVLAVVIGAVVTPLLSQGLKLTDNLTGIADAIVEQSHLQNLNAKFHLVDHVKSASQTVVRDLTGTGLPIVTLFGNIAGGAEAFTIIVVFVFFMLLEGPQGWEMCTRFLHPHQAERINRIAEKMMLAVGGFVSGNLFISLIAGTVALITMIALRIPYAFALAVLLAIFDLIPLVGAAIGTIAIAIVALTQGLVTMLVAVVILLFYQFIEGHIIQPIVYSRAISLSPFLIVLASVIGAALGGIVGVLLAIPVAAVLQIVIFEIFRIENVRLPKISKKQA